ETWDYTPEESNTTSPTDTGSYKTIYFTNDKNWNVTAYAWDSANNALLGTWPGTAMTFDYKNTFNQDVFKIFVPAGAVGVVFSNNGGAQTVDLVPADNTGYYPDSQEALGKWICKTWAPVHDVPTTVEVTTVEETTIEEPTVEESTIEETTVEATTEETNAPIYVDNFSASSYSISLKDSIAINFRVKPETVLGYTDPYLVVTMNNEETVINDYETLADGTLVFQFDKVYPQTVIDDASSVLHGFKGDQEYLWCSLYKVCFGICYQQPG
ncbi:MAG: starch-binding protein, partial [Ruminococcus sp.]|nr:starch-binding protein [Ruminococcus sp.]